MYIPSLEWENNNKNERKLELDILFELLQVKLIAFNLSAFTSLYNGYSWPVTNIQVMYICIKLRPLNWITLRGESRMKK